MNAVFQSLLHQLLQELGITAPRPAAPAAHSQARQIAELGSWIKKNIVARVRDLVGRIKVAVGSVIGAELSAHPAAAPAPDRAPAPASDIAPRPWEPRPASSSDTSDERETPEDERREPDALGPDDRRTEHGGGWASRPPRRQRTREQTSCDAERGARPTSVNQAA